MPAQRGLAQWGQAPRPGSISSRGGPFCKKTGPGRPRKARPRVGQAQWGQAPRPGGCQATHSFTVLIILKSSGLGRSSGARPMDIWHTTPPTPPKLSLCNPGADILIKFHHRDSNPGRSGEGRASNQLAYSGLAFVVHACDKPRHPAKPGCQPSRAWPSGARPLGPAPFFH